MDSPLENGQIDESILDMKCELIIEDDDAIASEYSAGVVFCDDEIEYLVDDEQVEYDSVGCKVEDGTQEQQLFHCSSCNVQFESVDNHVQEFHADEPVQIQVFFVNFILKVANCTKWVSVVTNLLF